MTDVASAAGPELDWRRPHPITIVVEIGVAIRSVIVAFVIVSGGFLGQAAILELALVAAPLFGGLARWYTTRYALDDESVHHHHGLIWRKKQVLPRSNVQNVSTKAGLLARLTSVVQLQISDASATGDIAIRYVAQEEADRLATLLRSDVATTRPAGSAGPAPDSETVLEDGRSSVATPGPRPGHPGSLVADGSGASPLSAPAPTGPAVALPPLISPSVGDIVRTELATASVTGLLAFAAVAAVIGPLLVLLEPFEIPDGAGRVAWFLAAGAVVGPLVLTAFGVAGQALVLGGFRLVAEPDRLRIQAGLITEARITARRERIQQIRVVRDLPQQALGIERVAFETADLEAEGTAATRYLAPTSPARTWRALASEAFGSVQLDEDDLSPVSRLTTRRMLVRFGFGAVPMVALTLIHPLLALVAIAAWLSFGLWFSKRRYREIGWAVSGDQYLVRTGVIHGRLTLVRLDKIQALWLASTFFQRRLDLATLRVSTAGKGFGGLVTLPDLPTDTAERLLTELAQRASQTPRADTL